MMKLWTALAGVACAWLAVAVPASGQDKMVPWQGSCLCERADAPGTFHLVITLTDANRVDIRKRLEAKEADTFKTVLLEAATCEEPKMCGLNKPILGNKTLTVTYKRFDGDQPLDMRAFDKAKTLTIGGKP